MGPVGIYFMIGYFLDDIDEENHTKMENFLPDLLRGTEQKNPSWRVMLDHLPDLLCTTLHTSSTTYSAAPSITINAAGLRPTASRVILVLTASRPRYDD